MLLESPTILGRTLVLEQEYRYTYETPIWGLRHRIVSVPREQHGRQERTAWDLTVAGADVNRRESQDRFGNHVIEIEAAEVRRELTFSIRSSVTWTTEEYKTNIGSCAVGIDDLSKATALTEANDELSAVARDIGESATSVSEFAERACAWTASALTYQFGATSVRTSATEALAGGLGVCQDFAHVMLAVCRSAKVPAYYVSGHLIGEGGSHAWVEVIDGTERLAFDPTHDRRTDHRYLTVAVGREYSDIAPTSGSFSGGGPGVLAARKTLSVLDAES